MTALGHDEAPLPPSATSQAALVAGTRPVTRGGGVVELAGGVRADREGLHDEHLGRTVVLDAPARYLLAQLLAHSTVSAAADAAARRVAAEPSVLAGQLSELAARLNRAGLVQPRGPATRAYLRHVTVAALGLLHGQVPSRQWLPTRRICLPASPGTAVATLLAAMLPAAVAVAAGVFCLVVVLFAGTGVVGGKQALVPATALALVAAAGPLVHEAGHLLTLGRRPAALLLRGLRPAVAHGPLPPARAFVVTAAGPLSGLAVGALVVSLSILFTNMAAAVVGLVFCSQVLGLTVLAADGRKLCSDRSSRS